MALGGLFVLIAAGTGLWAWQGLQSVYQPVDKLDEPVLFNVPSGSAYGTVVRKLQQEDIVDDIFWLRVYGRLYPERAELRAGEYEFTPGMSEAEVLAVMESGDTKTWPVQFLEGTRFQDIRRTLALNPHLKPVTAGWSDERIMQELGAGGEHPEGRFFPDTYLHSSQDSDLDLLRRAFERMENVLSEEWQDRAEGLPYESPYDALIMASIVERETGAPEEREEVAGVFVRRLHKGMRLQTDPTVIYGMGDAYEGRITRKDLRTTTPYNTYRIDGLPPTPIALPGREAIHAALHPADGDTLFFVARGDGTHKFSRTLSEHQEAVREFQLNRRSDYRSSPPPKPVEPLEESQ